MLKKIYIEITNICNLACSFCPQSARDKKMMEVDDFRSVLRQVIPLSKEICLHITGEPLAHPDFLKILGVCDEFKVTVELTTNGIWLGRYKNELLKSSSIKQINFSLQAFMDNYPGKDMSQYLFEILNFIKEGSVQRPNMYFNLRLWNQGTESQGNDLIFDYLEKYFDISINRLVDVGGFKSKRIWNKLYLHFDSRFEWPSLQGKCLGSSGKCKGLIDHIGILANGDVIPCCLDKDGIITLGNCFLKPLVKILEDTRAQTMRDGFLKGELVESLCQRCGYIRRFNKKAKTEI